MLLSCRVCHCDSERMGSCCVWNSYAEADADILMNEIVFNEVRLIYFKGETEEHDEFEIDRDDEKDM